MRSGRSILAFTQAASATLLLCLPRGIIRWFWFPLGGGGIRRAYFLGLIFPNQRVASLSHAGARRFIRRSSVKVGVAKGYVGLALLKQFRVIGYFSTVSPDPSHFRRNCRCYATRQRIEQSDRTKDKSVMWCSVLPNCLFSAMVHLRMLYYFLCGLRPSNVSPELIQRSV